MGRGNGESIIANTMTSRPTSVTKTNLCPAFVAYRRKEVCRYLATCCYATIWKAIIQRFVNRNLVNCFFSGRLFAFRKCEKMQGMCEWERRTDFFFADLVYVSEKEAPIEMRLIHRNRTQCKPHAQLSYLKIQENNPVPSRGINGLLHVCSIMICLSLAYISTKFWGRIFIPSCF